MRLEFQSLRRAAAQLVALAGLAVACGDSSGGSGLSATTVPGTGASGVTTPGTTGTTGTGTTDGSSTTADTGDVTTSSTTATPTTTTADPTLTTTATSATTSGTTGVVPPDLCAPAGNLIEVGSLDGGMNGEAPVGWEVRTPGQPANCAGSGPHVFASGPAPGCAGGGITVDANDAWDCYAVQTVSPYGSIQGGATYTIRATVRSQGNAVNPAAWFVLGVQWLDANDAFFGDEKNPQPADSADNDYDWKVLEWDLVAPANATRILVWMTAHYPGQVEYDHVAVIKKG